MARFGPGEICYVTGAYPQLSETFVLEEIRELTRRGAQPRVFAMFPGDAERSGELPEAKFIQHTTRRERWEAVARLLLRHPLRTLRTLLTPSRRFGGGIGDALAAAPLAVQAAGARHIHAHWATEPAAIAARVSELTGVRFSFTAHAYDIYRNWERVEEKAAAASVVVAVSESSRSYLAERLPRHAQRLVTVHSGVNVRDFQRSRPYDPEGPIVSVARLVEKKGFVHLIRALAAAGRGIPRMLIVGEGPQRAELETLIAETGADAELLGARTHTAARALLEGASASVLPCVVDPSGDRDVIPNSLKEAMALEVPVITSDIGGMDELVTGDAGRIVAAGDPHALAQAIDELFSLPPEARRAMGAAGRRVVAERFDSRRQVSELERLFERGAAVSDRR